MYITLFVTYMYCIVL